VKRNERKFEKEELATYGLIPIPLSGAGPVKEDGENEHFLAQLKSTQKESITLKKLDIVQLTHHATTSHKIPVFLLNIAGLRLVCFRQEHLAHVQQVARTDNHFLRPGA
jgi:hypothetical protein